MNRISTQIFALGGVLSLAGLTLAQTPKPATPAPGASSGSGVSKPAAPASGTASETSSGKPAISATDGITAPPDPNKVVLDINGDKMTAAQFEEMIKAFPPQFQAAANGPKRHEFIEQYVQLKLAAKEAERRNLASKAEVKQQLALQHDNVLASALYQDLMANAKVADADYQAYYDAHKKEFETAKAHHVLIRFKGSPVPLGKDKKELTEEEALVKAKEAEKRLAAGEDFAKVAQEMSDDTGTKDGDLGVFTRGQMVPAFDEAVFTQPIGKVGDPVKTQFGYHVIRVDSRESKPLSEVRNQIEQKIRPEMVKKQMDELAKKGNVTMDEAFFKGPAGPSK